MTYWNNITDDVLEGEEWRPIIGYENLYTISSFGRVKRVLYGKNKIRRQNQLLNGRLMIILSKNAINTPYQVHRLVALNFITNKMGVPNVLHIDDNPKNNIVSNLRWGTQKENIQDCHNKGRAHHNLPPPKSGKNHMNYGKLMPIERKLKISLTKRKNYNIKYNGQLIKFTGLKDFCDKKKLLIGSLLQVINNTGFYGAKNYYKGYSRM